MDLFANRRDCSPSSPVEVRGIVTRREFRGGVSPAQMNVTFMRFCQRFSGFRALAVRIPPSWYFRAAWWVVSLSSWFWPHAIRRGRIFRKLLRSNFSEKELSTRTRRYLYHVCLFKDIEIAWSNWEARQEDWITVDGESHLQDALRQERGVMLISPHNYGFSKLVAPVLTSRGYRVLRGGNGGRKTIYRNTRWGANCKIGWQYLSYKGDYWHRVQLLKTIQNALAANDIVHVSPRGYQHGEEDTAIAFFGRKYFLDATWFRVFQICRAPVLPCFAINDADGKIKIIIHRPLAVTPKKMVQEFAEIQSRYITQLPECGRLWKSVYADRSRW